MFTSKDGSDFGPNAACDFEQDVADLPMRANPNLYGHDDAGLFYDAAGKQMLDFITYDQSCVLPNKTRLPRCKPVCDSMGCDARRILGVRSSADGRNWSQPLQIREPDEEDADDLEFYDFRAFSLDGLPGGRVVGHMKNYAPSPWLAAKDTVMSIFCSGGDPHHCHGPHVMQEWWILEEGASPADLPRWRRPFRHQRAAPRDFYLWATPVLTKGYHVWIDNGVPLGLPEMRLSGLSSTSNARFTTRPFRMPAGASLWVNADVSWGRDGSAHTRHACNQGCAAYLMAELLDAESGEVLPGHEKEGCFLQDVDGARLPLAWPAGGADPAGKLLQLRFHMRDAVVFGVGAA